MQANSSGFLACNLPCASTEYMYWNSTCHVYCSSPLNQRNDSGYLTCSLPCNKSDYLYWNSTCLTGCSPPFIQRNNSGYLTCNLPCPNLEYMDWNSLCRSGCDLPFLARNNSGFLTCNLPCLNREYLYWNGSCLPTCNPPYIVENKASFNSCIQLVNSTAVNPANWNDFQVILATTKVSDNIILVAIFIASVVGIDSHFTNTLASFVKMLPYIRYIKINYPPRLQFMLDHFHSSTISLQFGFDMPIKLADQFAQYPLPSNFAKYQLKSSFLVTYWITMTSMLIVYCFSKILSAITYLLQKNKKLHSLLERINLIFKWNFLLLVFFSNFDGVILPTSLMLRTLNLDSLPNNIDLIVCIFINVTVISFYGLVIHIVRDIRKYKYLTYPEKSKAHIPEKKWQKYQVTYKDSQNKEFIQHAFLFFYLARLYLFYLVISYLFAYPLMQTILIALLNLLFLGYIVFVKPFASKLALIQYTSDETTMLGVNLCLVILAILDAKNIEHENLRFILGEVIIYTNLWFSLTAAGFLIFTIIVGIRRAYIATKRHGSRGAISFLLVFLSASDAGEIDVEVGIEHHDPELLNKDKTGETKSTSLNPNRFGVDLRKSSFVSHENTSVGILSMEENLRTSRRRIHERRLMRTKVSPGSLTLVHDQSSRVHMVEESKSKTLSKVYGIQLVKENSELIDQTIKIKKPNENNISRQRRRF